MHTTKTNFIKIGQEVSEISHFFVCHGHHLGF